MEENKSLHDTKNFPNALVVLPPILYPKIEHSILEQREIKNEGDYQNFIKALDMEIGESIIKQERNECVDNKFDISTSKHILENDEYVIKTEHIDIKLEEDTESNTIVRSDSTHQVVEEMQSLNCDLNLGSENHIIKDLEKRDYVVSNDKPFHCDKCSFASKYKRCYIRHQLNEHSLMSQTYTCDMCNFRTNNREIIIVHLSKHKNPSEEEWYECDQCNYASKSRNNFRKHHLVHNEPSRVYKCSECSFDTRYRGSLKKHQLRRHKALSQGKPTYKCETCDYKTSIKYDMKKHQLKHRNVSKEEMYRCDECSYETKYKSNITLHGLKHKDSTEVLMYNCGKCSYETKRKSSLVRHQLVHKDVTYKCDECSFETKYKGYHKKHRKLLHIDASEQGTI